MVRRPSTLGSMPLASDPDRDRCGASLRAPDAGLFRHLPASGHGGRTGPFSDRTLERERLLATLDALRSEGLVQRHEGHWSLRDASKAVLGRRRRTGNGPASACHVRRPWPGASPPSLRAGRVRERQPGAWADGDIDFFIITRTGAPLAGTHAVGALQRRCSC